MRRKFYKRTSSGFSTPDLAYTQSPDQFSTASTDDSLRDAVNCFENYIDLDSEIFNAELEKFMEGDS